MLPLTKKELKSYQDAKLCYICEKQILRRVAKDKNHQKVRDHWRNASKYRGAGHSICNLKLNVSNEIPVDFHYDSNYDYHFIIEELANEFKGQY